MKIVHIITGLNDGGAEGVLFRLCSYDRGHKHVVISLLDEGKYGSLLKKKGIEVHKLSMRAGRPSLIGFLRLVSLVRSSKPDVVQTWMYHADFLGGLAAKLAGVKPIVWGIRNSTLEPLKSKKTTIWIAKILALLSWWLPSKIVVCARRAIDVHEAMGYNGAKFRFIPNGYDLSSFKNLSDEGAIFRKGLGLSADLQLIGVVGRYDPYKDHANLFKALALLNKRDIKFKCLLVGTNLDITNIDLMRSIEKLGLRDSLLLLGSRNQIPTIMSALDVHVLPSSAEAFPNVVAEAMACETPCVVTDVGDAAYIVGETGWVVPPQNADALANAIEEAIIERRDARLWGSRRTAARDRIATKFSIERMAQTYGRIWEEARAESLA